MQAELACDLLKPCIVHDEAVVYPPLGTPRANHPEEGRMKGAV